MLYCDVMNSLFLLSSIQSSHRRYLLIFLPTPHHFDPSNFFSLLIITAVLYFPLSFLTFSGLDGMVFIRFSPFLLSLSPKNLSFHVGAYQLVSFFFIFQHMHPLLHTFPFYPLVTILPHSQLQWQESTEKKHEKKKKRKKRGRVFDSYNGAIFSVYISYSFLFLRADSLPHCSVLSFF